MVLTSPALWLLWVVLVARNDAFSIEPVTAPIIPNQAITVTWLREPEETEPFALVKSGVNQGTVNFSLATVPVNATPGETTGAVEVTFLQTTEFVIHAIYTGSITSTFYTDPRTVTAIPSGAEGRQQNLAGSGTALPTSSSSSLSPSTGFPPTTSDPPPTSNPVSYATSPTSPVGATKSRKRLKNEKHHHREYGGRGRIPDSSARYIPPLSPPGTINKQLPSGFL
ncbi:hypothetical protein Moror_9540 [Moniliophthora roreri MCA 2997]|uniref:Uncharacterized protein n=2 Tax=Moniliophthora roreri TaxID=221103 RepID=V2XBR2_MONRO|nr:hypothetical protein Moror_9540 [Moniliophthora roreri MCA 2997]